MHNIHNRTFLLLHMIVIIIFLCPKTLLFSLISFITLSFQKLFIIYYIISDQTFFKFHLFFIKRSLLVDNFLLIKSLLLKIYHGTRHKTKKITSYTFFLNENILDPTCQTLETDPFPPLTSYALSYPLKWPRRSRQTCNPPMKFSLYKNSRYPLQ